MTEENHDEKATQVEDELEGLGYSDYSESSSSSSSSSKSSSKADKSEEAPSSHSSEKAPATEPAKPVQQPRDEPGGLFVAPIERAKVADRTPPVDLDNEVYRSAASAFMARGTLPEKSDRSAVYMYLNREATAAAVAHNYDGAERYYQATRRYLEACHESDRSEIKDTKKDELQQMIDDSHAKLEQVRAQWKDRITEAEHNTKERTEDAKRENAQEMEDFKEHWADPESVRPFAKPSSSLIELRDTERKMVLVGMFKRAKEVKAKADALQQRETEEAQANCLNEVTTKRDQLLKSQQEKLDRIQRLGEKKVTDMKRRQQAEENGIEKRIDNLKLQLQMSMTRKSVPGLVRPITNVRARSMTVSEPLVGVKAPQSRNQMYRFSKTSYVKKLTLQPLSQYKKGGAPKET